MLVAGQVASLAEKLLKPPSTKCKAVAEEEMEMNERTTTGRPDPRSAKAMIAGEEAPTAGATWLERLFGIWVLEPQA